MLGRRRRGGLGWRRGVVVLVVVLGVGVGGGGVVCDWVMILGWEDVHVVCCDFCQGSILRSSGYEFNDAAWKKDWLVTPTHSLIHGLRFLQGLQSRSN